MRDRIKVCIGKNKELLECIIVCLLTSFFTFILFIVRGEGSFTTHADFNLQNIPFTTAMHNAVAEGGFNSFSWNLDLGTSTIQGYSYYNLGSPFFWISMLFPAASYPYVVGWMYMLKYTVAGCVAFAYLKRFVHNPRLAVIGGVLYAFSGFSATNLMYHFQDMIAFFPLMLIGLECYMEDKKKKGIFIFAVALNALVNYFFFVQSVVFLCIYFLFRFWKKEWKENFKNIGGCMICGIMGVCLAAPIFIPSVMYILLGNNQNGSMFYINNLVDSSASCLATLKAMFFPAELQSNCSAIEQANYSSTAAYLPMTGVTFVIAYVQKHRDWLSRILILMFVMSFSPLLSSAFLLFTGFYHRWWMAFVLMMILATVLVLDRAKDYKVLSSAVINGLMVIGMWAFVMFVPWGEGFEPSVFREKLFCVHTGIALAGVILCVIGVTKLKLSDKYMLCCVCIFSILTTSLAIYDYQRDSETGHEYLEAYKLGASLLVHDDQYRYTSSNNMLVFQGEGAGMGCFTSTRSNAIKKFDSYFGVDTDIVSMDKMGIRGCSELLGGKYYVTGDAEDKTALQEIVSNGVIYYVYEREACPIGFSVSSFITESELAEIPVENRGIALLAAALVSEEDADAISGELIQATSDSINFGQSVSDYVTVNSANAVTDFERDAEGFSCKTVYAEPRYVYFSVPYDNDWTLYVDGEKSEIISSGGMMLVRVPAGEHSLVFEYSTPFYHLGIAMCLGAIVIMAAYEFMHRKKFLYRTIMRDKRGFMMSGKGKI